MMSIKFSVIIPCYNVSKFINSLINSINKCSVLPNEIIFVNDCSTDKTLQVLEALNLKGIKKKIVSTKINSGPGNARNLGVEHSSYEYLFFLDSDTTVTSNLFKIYLSKIEKYNAVIGMYHYQSLNKGFFQELKSYYYYFMLYKKYDYQYSIFSSSCAGIKKKYFNKIDGFDNWFGLNKIDYENEDLGKRLSQITKMWMIPEMQVYHFFPKNIKLIKTLVLRTSHWIEDFFLDKNKSFDEAGGTKKKGLKCILSFFIVMSLILSSITFFNFQLLNFLLIFTATVSLYFNWEFLFFLKQKKKSILKFYIGILLFETLISVGAFYGLIKILFGISKFKKK